MTDTPSHIEQELKGHSTDIDTWANSVKTLDITKDCQGVRDRFVRDCETLKNDMDMKEEPSTDDLIDFSDYRNSLEVRYIKITQDWS